ncbi:MAG: hypothetical protein IJS81_00100, partial [Selenomonadaceae bacterium]|nr:hypothetical protein [Selenomonadaceae bacterium]
MVKKFFLFCLMMLLVVQSAASAKDKGLPEEERIKVAIEITDDSRYEKFGTAQNLESFLNEKLIEKNLINVVNEKQFDEEITAEQK